jgi:hypothetical protein
MDRRRATILRLVWLGVIALVVGLYFWGRDRTPPEFADRAVLPACGTVEQAALGAGAAGAAEQCLSGGGGGELVVTGMTDEGARVVTYYRAVPGKPGLEIFDDRSADRFSSEDWVYRECPAASGPSVLGACASRELSGW